MLIGLVLILISRVSGLVLPGSTQYLVDDIIIAGKEDMFGLFALFPLIAIPAFDRRARNCDGQDALVGAPILSVRPVFDRAWWRQNARPVLMRSAVGVLFWCVVLHLHAPVIGAWPFP